MTEAAIDRGPRTSVPRYLEVAAALRDGLLHHRPAPGSRLPSERHLALRFRVNRQTVRSALQLLREEGLVLTDRRGTFAAHRIDPADPTDPTRLVRPAADGADRVRRGPTAPYHRPFPGGPRAADALVRTSLSWEAPPVALTGRLGLTPGEPTLVHRHTVLTPAGASVQRSVSWFSRPALAEVPQLGRFRRGAERFRQPDLRLLYHWMRLAGLRTTHRESVGLPAPADPQRDAVDAGRGASRLSVHRVVSDQHGHALEITDIDLAAHGRTWTYEYGG
ncbi:GntR family transcriptional regulator [Streptomyces sp. NPDC046203]|uniref:GntR family transcriptional regulator n=1 Tax=Streptomyces sp. NPDC046203 TaxID=3154602 RepID=UPI0033DB8F87